MEQLQSNVRGYEGFETFTNALRMGLKMHTWLFGLIVVLHVVMFIGIMVFTHTPNRQRAIQWAAAKVLAMSFPTKTLNMVQLDGSVKVMQVQTLAVSPWALDLAARELRKTGWIFAGSAWVYLLYPVLVRLFRRRSKKQSSKKYVRGAMLITAEAFQKEIAEKSLQTRFPLGTIAMPVDLENRTTMIIGKPGTGKSQCFRQILKSIRRQNGQAIVYDHKGEYLTEFFDSKTDMIFNPLDQRSLGWNVFNELTTYMDVDALSASLIPASISQMDPFWNDAARGVFAGCLHHLFQNELTDNAQLWRLLTSDAKIISEKLSQTKGGEAGYRYITQNSENSRQADSVLSVMMQFSRCFEYMADNDGCFSIADWLTSRSGIIYITNYEDIEETLRPVLSLFIDLVGRRLLSMADDLDRRIYLLLDEFGSLQRMGSIVRMITKGRSKGASLFIGIQDDGQMEKTYGRQLLRTLDNAPGNRITFALSGETAEREAKYNIGETEYWEVERSQSMGPSDFKDGVSLRPVKKREQLFLPSDIANLPDLTGIVKLRDNHYVLSKWEYEKPQQIHDRFLLREDLVLENIVAKQQEIQQELGQVEINFIDA